MRMCNINASGTEKIICFKVVNDPLPIGWLLSKSTTAMFFYQAHTDCELYVIDKKDFNTHLTNNGEFALQIANFLASAYVSVNLQVDALTQTSARLKLLYVFRHLCLRYGQDTDDGISQLRIPLTQQELANYTGLTRETTTVELNRFKLSGIVSYRQKYYTINTKMVDNLIEDEYNPGVTRLYKV